MLIPKNVSLAKARRAQREQSEEKLAELYVQTKNLLSELTGIPSRKMFDILGGTLLTQIQGTIYWMARALAAEKQLADWKDELKGMQN